MGIIYQTNKSLVRDYSEETAVIRDILIEPGREQSQVKLGPLSSMEADTILHKLDTLAMQTMVPAVATILAEEAQAVIVAVRMVKEESKEGFMGILGSGANLDMVWLRALHVGGPILNPAGTASKGLYAGTSGAVETWLNTTVQGTSLNIIPSQVMAEEGALIYFGGIDPIEVPKIEAIRFTISGIPTDTQPAAFNFRHAFGTNMTPLFRLEKPVLIGPERTQQVDIHPHISGDDKFQFIALVIAKAENLTLDPGL